VSSLLSFNSSVYSITRVTVTRGWLGVLTFARWVSRSVRALMYSRILSLKAALTTFHWWTISDAVLHSIWSIRSRYSLAFARAVCDLVIISLLCSVQLSWLETLWTTQTNQYTMSLYSNSKQCLVTCSLQYINYNRFWLFFVCFVIASSHFFHTHVLLFILLFVPLLYSLLLTLLHVRLLRAFR